MPTEVLLRIMIGYFVVINLVAFALMGIDKNRAKAHLWRISQMTLFLSALVGGSVGAILGMWVFHYKTKHWYFVVGMPLILLAQVLTVSFILRNLMGYFH